MKERIKEIEKYLPGEWKEKCKELKALQRGREIKTAEELLELNLMYLTIGGSYGTTSTLLNLTTDKRMSKKAVYTRIQNSGEWLKWMSQEMLIENKMLLPKPEWLKGNVKIVDGSELSVKGSREGDYMLHFMFNLFEFTGNFEITDISQGESLRNYEFEENDIVIGDRGYISIKGIEHVKENKADFILRYRKNSFTLYDENGDKIDILARAAHLKELESTSVYGYYHSGKDKCPVRLVVIRKDKKAEEKAVRKMKKNYSRKQRKAPQKETIEMNKYIILATSLEETDERISELYRARWQIEQVFYRLKSLFSFGDVPSKKDKSVKAWFYGKMFLAVLAETILKTESFSPKKKNNHIPLISSSLWNSLHIVFIYIINLILSNLCFSNLKSNWKRLFAISSESKRKRFYALNRLLIVK